ncbi:pectate lyase-like adhesive domain-containing protein [Roseburia sp. AF42-8]|uniref:pectate lyase-like adhesive domain-containing protein n=1 Tax=Roseburia sp. AF42-8 TaxID=2293137 RepID=UPI001FA858AA|nr:pectate lyase-like adhesive domain-containing protein [Roseburia sp. AF42-8]
MKKRLFSILLALCMVLCLVPTTAFAESETEEPPVCTCETACTAEAMNADCPICGAEGALPENCECSEPIENAEPEGEENEEQSEGEVSDPQPETALTSLIGGSETVTEVSTADELTAAVADSKVNTVKLTGDISISNSLTVNRTVTLDLNGHVLKYESANKGSVIVVEGGGQLTIEDSNTSNLSHRFNPNGKLWVLDEASGTETVTGGVITGGTGYPILLYGSYYHYGGGVYIASGGQLTMTGGNIIGCSATYGGGVHIDGESGQFSMSGGSIAGCVASIIGGGVRASGTFKMSGQAVIRSCTAESATQFVFGGGVYVNGSSSFEMSGEAKIKGCQAISNSSHSSNGGGVYVSSSSSFVMSGEAKIEDCKEISNSSKSSNGGGVFLANGTSLTLSGNAVIQNCTATNSVNSGEAYGGGVRAFYVREITLAGSASIAGCAAANGSGLYITGSTTPGYGILYANGGSVDGDVVLGDTTEGPCTITGSGETVFKGKVTVTPGSTIENGKFNGEVINNGTITGGVFNSTVSGSGIINGGTFNGTPDHITGSGTETDPYQISTAAGLKWFRDKVNDAKTEEETKICAVLTAAIDLNNEPWTPIGNYTEGNKIYYEGTFDGGGHTISGLNVTDNFRYASLFGAVKGGTIKNLTVAGNVSHNYNLTGLACHVGGIVGGALDAATIENCSNNCSVTGGSGDYIGGIAGSNIDNARIIDCYNVGTITGTINGTGGVTWLNMGTISNCYNVGTIKTPYNSDAVGEIVGRNHGTVENCYYLAGTNLNAVGQNNSNGNITKTESKTAANFANDTVLALLKADRDNSPWDSCQYVAAAKITLPVFKGQGDEHTHNGNWTSNDNGTHSRRCTCNVVETQNCSGGTATCTQRAKCTVCGAEYGDVLGHDFTTSWTHDDNEHWKQCSRCDKKDDVGPHTWDNGTITTAPTCTKAGKKTYSCTKCDATKIEPIPATGHSWKSDWTSDATHHWHECANENCDVTDNAGKKGYAEHSGGKATCTQNAVCEFCKAEYGEKLPHDFTAETVDAKYLKSAATCTEKAVYYKSCAVCGLSSEGTADEATFFSGNALDHNWGAWTQNSDEKTHTRICKRDTSHTETENCIDANKDHKCDICDYIISECADDNKDRKCDYCGKKLIEHTGGKATCKDKAKCEVCGAEYGELDAKNHTDLKHFPATAATKTTEGNIEYWYCEGCGKYYSDKDGTKEIKKADTVTAKLKDDSKSPQTGDTSNLALWIALLFVSSGAAIGTTVVSRKKKYNK